MEKFYEKELLEELHEVQDTYGYIPEEDIVRISKDRDIAKAHLYGIISFYSMFYTEPTGKYIIRICDSVSCRLGASQEVLDAVRNYTNIKDTGTSEDLKFTLEVVECLGHCGEGPVMTVNGKFHKYLTPQKAVDVLKSLD